MRAAGQTHGHLNREFLNVILSVAMAAVITLTSESKKESIVCKLLVKQVKKLGKVISLFPCLCSFAA